VRRRERATSSSPVFTPETTTPLASTPASPNAGSESHHQRRNGGGRGTSPSCHLRSKQRCLGGGHRVELGWQRSVECLGATRQVHDPARISTVPIRYQRYLSNHQDVYEPGETVQAAAIPTRPRLRTYVRTRPCVQCSAESGSEGSRAPAEPAPACGRAPQAPVLGPGGSLIDLWELLVEGRQIGTSGAVLRRVPSATDSVGRRLPRGRGASGIRPREALQRVHLLRRTGDHRMHLSDRRQRRR